MLFKEKSLKIYCDLIANALHNCRYFFTHEGETEDCVVVQSQGFVIKPEANIYPDTIISKLNIIVQIFSAT